MLVTFFSAQVDRLVVMAGPHILLSGVNMTAQQAQKSWYILLFQVRVWDLMTSGICQIAIC